MRIRKILLWVVCGYLGCGLLLAVLCLVAKGEQRFGVFSWFIRYTFPSSFLVTTAGLDGIFENWPAAVFWNSALLVINTVVGYGVIRFVPHGARKL